MPCDSDLTDNCLLKISVPISADVLKGYFQLLVLSPSLWWHCTQWVESSRRNSVIEGSRLLRCPACQWDLGQKQQPAEFSEGLASIDPCSPGARHCTLPYFLDSLDSSSKWPLIRTAVPVVWLGRFDLTLFKAIVISPGSCSIGVTESKASHDFSDWQVVMVMGWEG